MFLCFAVSFDLINPSILAMFLRIVLQNKTKQKKVKCPQGNNKVTLITYLPHLGKKFLAILYSTTSTCVLASQKRKKRNQCN
jgi:hypothetical protein